MTTPNRVQRRGRRAQSGFTLIELLVVIAILGVLAGIVVFNVAGVTNRGNTAACNADAHTVQVAEDAYRSDNAQLNGTPGPVTTDVNLLVSKGYLHTAPDTTKCAITIDSSTGTVTGTPK